MKEVYKQLSDLKHRKVKLFESKDTSLKLLVFEYEHRYNSNTFYIKYPESVCFIELYGSFTLQSGDINTGSVTNPWKDKYNQNIEIYNNGEDLLIKEGSFNINFLTKKDIADHIFDFMYLKLPFDIVSISKSYKTEDVIPTYFLLYYPSYYSSYYNLKVIKIYQDIIEELEVCNHQVYRDGGTTIIDVKGYNNGFYFPTPFNKQLISTFNENIIIKNTEEETNNLIQLLKLNVKDENKKS